MTDIAANAVADWCRLDIGIFHRLYDRWIAGTDAKLWSVLTAQVPPLDESAIKKLRRAACCEAVRAEVLGPFALSICKIQVEMWPEAADGANELIQVIESLNAGGRMQALVMPGGLLTRDTLLGTLAVDSATAIVYRNADVIGTAFLVAPDLVLTAAHVVLRVVENRFEQTLSDELSFSFRVYVGNTGKEPVVAYPAPSAALVASSLPWGVPPDTLYVPPETGSPNQLDFALVRLDREIRHVGALDIRTPPSLAASDPLVVLGFPGGTAMRWHVGSVAMVDTERVQHLANALPGMSGSCCINVHGKPAAVHEGSLRTKKFALGGDKGPTGTNRAVSLSVIRNAMRVGAADPLLGRSKSPALDFHDEAMVRRWAKAGLRLAPPELQAQWRLLVKDAITVEPEDPGPVAAFHPWFRRDAFEQWVDANSGSGDARSRLCIVSGNTGTGKSFLASILRARLGWEDPVVISATETTAWSWRDALEKWGVALDAPGLRPEAGVAMHDEAPRAAHAIAGHAGRHASPRPLFVMIDFDGTASFHPGDQPPWLPFMSELIGFPWVRLAVVGAPESVTMGLADRMQDDGLGDFIRSRLEHINADDFRNFVRQMLRKGGRPLPPEQLDKAMKSFQRICEALPAPQLQTAAAVLAATMLRQDLGELAMNELLDLRPAPQRLAAEEGLDNLHARLDRLLAPGAAAAPVLDAALPNGSALLRRRLAVRGWVPPGLLKAGIADVEWDEALRVVGQEVELAERARPGRWFMALAARKRVFATVSLERLREASESLHPGEEQDPVWSALRLALDPFMGAATNTELVLRQLAQQRPEVLRELSRMAAWGSTIPGLADLAALADAQLGRQRRDRDLEAVKASQLFGREQEMVLISMFLQQPPSPRDVPVLYVSGIGGSGKSTLLLAAEQELRRRDQRLVVRLDFDNAYLDPLSQEQMDILFLRALVIEEPELAPRLQRVLAQLQRQADARVRIRMEAEGENYASSSSASTPSQRKEQLRRARYATKSGSSAEEAGMSEKSERISVLQSVGDEPAFRQRSVVLFLDTVENVSRLGADAIDSVLEWLGSIPAAVPRRDLRVVLAGRDALGSPDMQALANRFEDHGLQLAESVAIGDLDAEAACNMLMQRGLPVADAMLAAQALPRNPLVLRLAADAWRTAKDDVAAIQDDYRNGRIDRQTASGYLAQRVIQHVPRQPARRYAVAAMALEKLTEKELRDIVIPAVDGVAAGDRKLAHKIYEGLRRATWLAIEEKPGQLRWHPELRELALPMIAADPDHASVDLLVRSAAQVRQKRPSTPEHLLDLASKLLYPVAGRLQRATGIPLAEVVSTELRQAEDNVHRIQLEGIGGAAGEGDRLVAQGRSARALEIYRDRPTRDKGVPPTFVIRALAQTGDWAGDDVDAAQVVRELRRHFDARGANMQPPMVERLYWLTRVQMLRTPALDRAHVDLLRDTCRTLKFRPRDGALFGLVGVAEAQVPGGGLSLIAPSSWPPPNTDLGPEARFSMVRAAYARLPSTGSRGLWVTTTLGAMLTFNEYWVDELLWLSGQECLEITGGTGVLHELKSQMPRLRTASLAEVEQFVSSCREVRVRLNLSRVPPDKAARVMRGTLVEFHSPLATQLSSDGYRQSLDGLLDVVARLPPSNSVLTLAEFNSADRREVHQRDIRSAFTAVLVALDRARLLGEFCRQLLREPARAFGQPRAPGARRALELVGRYLAWEQALDPFAAAAANERIAS